MANRVTETPAYSTVHTRLMRKRGSARNFECVDCGGTAEQWSLNADCPNKVMGVGTKKDGIEYYSEYSYNIDDYSPRCVDCHLKHDGKTVNNGVCEFEGCDRDANSKGLCKAHYQQHYRGLELTPIRKYGDAA